MRGHLYGGDRFSVWFSPSEQKPGGGRQRCQPQGRGQLGAKAARDRVPGLGAGWEWVGLGALQRLVGQLGLAWQGLGLGVGPRGGLWREDVSRPRGALTNFGLHGGGQRAGHEGKFRGRGRQHKLSNRLQGRHRGQGVECGSAMQESAMHPCPPPTCTQNPRKTHGCRHVGVEHLPRKKTSNTQENTQNKTKNVQLARAARAAGQQHHAWPPAGGNGEGLFQGCPAPPEHLRFGSLSGGGVTHPGAAEWAGGEA